MVPVYPQLFCNSVVSSIKAMSDISTYSEYEIPQDGFVIYINSSSYVVKVILRALSLSFRSSSLAPLFIICPVELITTKTITFIVINTTTTPTAVMPNYPNSKGDRFCPAARGTTIHKASFCGDKSGTTSAAA